MWILWGQMEGGEKRVLWNSLIDLSDILAVTDTSKNGLAIFSLGRARLGKCSEVFAAATRLARDKRNVGPVSLFRLSSERGRWKNYLLTKRRRMFVFTDDEERREWLRGQDDTLWDRVLHFRRHFRDVNIIGYVGGCAPCCNSSQWQQREVSML